MNVHKKKTTIIDVAEKAGVSKGTVSAVINNRPSVKLSTREHVLEIMKDLHFRPKGHARSLKSSIGSKSIGLIIRELDNPFYMTIARGVKQYANSKNYILFIASSESCHDDEEEISQLFNVQDVKGAIIAPVISGNTEIDHLFRLKMLNYPFVMLEAVNGIRCNVVSINNIEATKSATKYFIDSGYSNIFHFSGPEEAYHTMERIQGFKDAFSESHLKFSENHIITCGAHFENGLETGRDFLKNFNPVQYPIGVICYNDMTALGLITALNELNIPIPEKVAVIGHDDIKFAEYWNPALTTVGVNLEELGRKAAEILIKNIESEQPLPMEHILLDSSLVLRKTTKNA